jgi:hypothetical protein
VPPDNRNFEFPTPPSAVPAKVRPGAPTSVAVVTLWGDRLRAEFDAPLRGGGNSLTSYRVEWDQASSFASGATGSPLGTATPSTSDLLVVREDTTSSGGSLPARYIYDISGLSPGQSYHVRVAAVGDVMGTGPYAVGSPAPAVPVQPPSPPTSVRLQATSRALTIDASEPEGDDAHKPITTLEATWAPPAATGGAAVDFYRVEWFEATSAREEVQIVQIDNSVSVASTAGTWRLHVNQSTTQALSPSATAIEVRYALMSMGLGAGAGGLVGHVEVTRTDVGSSPVKGYAWQITFADGATNPGDVAPLALVSGLTASGSSTVSTAVTESVRGVRAGGAREVQVVQTRSTTGAAVAGFFRLAYGVTPEEIAAGTAGGVVLEEESVLISAAATADDVQRALSSIPALGEVTVTRRGINTATNEYEWRVTFASTVPDRFANETSTAVGLRALVADTNGLRPSGAAVVDVFGADFAVSSDVNQNLRLLCDACAPAERPVGYRSVDVSASTFAHTLDGLNPGEPYALRVSAINKVGPSLPAASTPATLPPAQLQPGAPLNVTSAAVPSDATKLSIGFVAPRYDGGSPVKQYRIEWSENDEFSSGSSRVVRCPNNPAREVQRIVTSTTDASAINGGSFVLSVTAPVTGTTTPSVATTTMEVKWDTIASAPAEISGNVYNGEPAAGGSLESILEAVSNVEKVVVNRETGLLGGYTWFVTFINPSGDIPTMSVTANWLNTTANSASSTPGANTSVVVTGLADGELFAACEGPQVISGLVKGVPLKVRVAAYNDVGYGPTAIAQSGALVAPADVPGLPTDASLEVIDAGTLRAKWSPPVDSGGRSVTSYLVQWSTSPSFGSFSSATVSNLAGGAPFVYSIKALTRGTTYYVRIRAVNSIGESSPQATVPSSAKPFGLSSQPTDLRIGVTSGRSNDSKVTVGFGMPTDDGGDTVTGFRIEWDVIREMDSLTPKPDKGFVVVAASDTLSYTISNLAPGRTYFVRVGALNRAGARFNDLPLVVKPALQVPGKPSSGAVATVPACPTCLSVSWSAPVVPAHGIYCSGGGLVTTGALACPQLMGRLTEADGGSVISRYIVQWSTSSDFGETGVVSDNGESTVSVTGAGPYTFSVTGLTSTTTYYVRVAASNEKGLSAFASQAGTAADGLALTATTT